MLKQLTKMSRQVMAVLLTVILIVSVVPFSTFASENSGFAGGSGTAEDPYLISTKYHLDNVRNYLNSNFKLINDIEFTEMDFSEDGDFYNYGVCWKPIGDSTTKFTGNFDGNNFKIKNLQIHKKNSDYVGLFGYVYNGNVSNVHLVDANIEGKNYVGSVCGYLHSASVNNRSSVVSAYITSCYSSGNVIGYGTYTGGICGYMNGVEYGRAAPGGSSYAYADAKVESSLNEANITGGQYAGGIVGYASSAGCTIDACVNNGTITATTAAGGILGYSDGETGMGWSSSSWYGTKIYYYFEYAILSNCINKGNVTASNSGGIIGDAYYTTYGTNGTYNGASNSYNIGTLTGDSVGGIIPCQFTGKIENCFYLDTCASDYSTSYGTSVSANDLKLIDTFTTWEFDSVWTMAGDKNYKYPELQCFTLQGEVSLDGNIAYMDTITPNISAIDNAYSDLTYDWYIDNEFVQTGQTYTVADGDVGKTIKVKAISSHPMSLGSVESEGKIIIKAQQVASPEVPELLSKNDATFEIATVITQEYSIDNETWQTSGIFENLDPNKEYTVYSRILENDLYLLGESKAVLTFTTDRRPLSGVVNITGASRFGDTLTADVSAVGPDSETTYSYEWKREDQVVGTDSTYTVVKEDVGKNITLSVIGTGDYIGTLTSAAVTATKTTVQLPNAPVVEEKTNNSIKLIEKEGYEYSKDKVAWQDSPLFEGLYAATEYTFYQRAKETETTFASKSSSGTTAITLKNSISAPEKPAVENITNISVTLKKISGYEYSLDGLTWQTSNVFDGLSPNTEYAFCQRIAENATDYASAQSGYTFVVTLKNSVVAPAAPTVQSATDSIVILTSITGYEYSIDGINWQKSNTFENLTVLETYNFYQRIFETETDYASPSSEALSFKVKNVVTIKPASPTLKEKTNNKIEINNIDGYEYSIDGYEWSTNAVFENLQPNTAYSIYCRTYETDTHYSSEISEALIVTTLKNSIKSPAAPVLLSKTDSSVTLVLVDGCEYSKDGIVWQESNAFEGLSPNVEYIFYQRIAETDIDYASEKSEGLKVCTLKMTVSTPSAPKLFEKTDTSVTLVKISGYEYSIDGSVWQESNIFDELDVNTEYSFYRRVAETDTSYASEKSAPLVVKTQKHSAGSPKDVVAIRIDVTSITLAPYAGYEFSMDGVSWQSDNHFDGLKANTQYTFYQRIAETDDYYASQISQVVKITTLPKINCSIVPPAPIVADYTSNKVVLVEFDGYEYSRNGTTWQDSATFTGLSSSNRYTFYQRIKETDTHTASVISNKTVVDLNAISNNGTTSADNYAKLVEYINKNGITTDSNSNKRLFYSEIDGDYLYGYTLENTSDGIVFKVTIGTSKWSISTQFVLKNSSKYISTKSSLTSYTYSDSVMQTISIDRSAHTLTSTYALNKEGYYISASEFSEIFNLSLALLCNYWDLEIYDALGFGLRGLGFTSYAGMGLTACDIPSSSHAGEYETRDQRSATCTVDGYTGDKYCTRCGEKRSTGSVIKSVGYHIYDNDCDANCNVCNEGRAINHIYSDACDCVCDLCGNEREATIHTYDIVCDTICNECGFERKAPHSYDDRSDLICNICGVERPPYTPGDINNDGQINNKDLGIFMQYLNGWEVEIVADAADVNGDGAVNNKDYGILMQYLNGWNVELK